MNSDKLILVATIGTRDLIFQISSGEWYNIGDDRLKDGEIIGDQVEIVSDLGLDWQIYSSFRKLTQYLWENIEDYLDKIKPVILGKLLEDSIDKLEKVYLVVTDQNEKITQREKDTFYSGKLIKNWLEKISKNIEVNLICLGENETNPSDFEQMFQWWQKVWKETIQVKSEQPIILCLKGGVGQTSEASRISALSLYGEQIQFYDFTQNTFQNRQGICSDYSEPFLGTNYLWNRAQKEALKLLERYDYAGVQNILEPYFRQNTKIWSITPNLIKAGLAWNQGQFKQFFQLAKSCLERQQQKQESEYWWMAYEQAYTAVVRFEQKNTTEAMLHSFRAVEGLIFKWIETNFQTHLQQKKYQYPRLKKSICNEHPILKICFEDKNNKQKDEVKLEGWIQQKLVEAAISEASFSDDFQAWSSNEVREVRNKLSHQLGGISEKELFEAWGKDINVREKWESRILNCLNLITNNHQFTTLKQASLFACIHERVKQAIAKL